MPPILSSSARSRNFRLVHPVIALLLPWNQGTASPGTVRFKYHVGLSVPSGFLSGGYFHVALTFPFGTSLMRSSGLTSAMTLRIASLSSSPNSMSTVTEIDGGVGDKPPIESGLWLSPRSGRVNSHLPYPPIHR